jgi:hypothetical protein
MVESGSAIVPRSMKLSYSRSLTRFLRRGIIAAVANSSAANSHLPAFLQWTIPGRFLVFTLAAASIWCLLSEMYNLVDMRTFFFAILLPSTAVLYGIAFLDRFRGDGRLWRAVILGTFAGLVGAIAYDMFRLPFVYSEAWGLDSIGIPEMPLFKVFPHFGALILGQPIEQLSYSLAAELIGWAYHFSNGATFGVMFAAMYVGAREATVGEFLRNSDSASRRNRANKAWMPVACATLMAVGIELCLLASPYASFFGIHLTPRFIVVTMIAHVVFGLGLGAYFAWHAAKWQLPTQAATAYAYLNSKNQNC